VESALISTDLESDAIIEVAIRASVIVNTQVCRNIVT
jgi:hypothetical protein